MKLLLRAIYLAIMVAFLWQGVLWIERNRVWMKYGWPSLYDIGVDKT